MSTPSPNPFKKPPFAAKGDRSADKLSLAVGQALSQWEHVEGNFAQLFGAIIRPIYNSYAARRAYGAIASARGRREVLEAVAAVFFRNFPDAQTKEALRVTLKYYSDASARRNDLAHGIVGRDKNENGKSTGYFILPSTWNTNKRGLHSEISYRYSSEDIRELVANFNVLGSQAIGVLDQIDNVFAASPEKLQKRW